MPAIRTFIAALALGAAAPAALAEQDAATKDAAYAACVSALAPLLEPTGDDPVAFAPAEDVFGDFGDEFSVSFTAGTISGVVFDEPHPLTLVDKPAGSCWAYDGQRKFYRVILNGKVLEGDPVAF